MSAPGTLLDVNVRRLHGLYDCFMNLSAVDRGTQYRPRCTSQASSFLKERSEPVASITEVAEAGSPVFQIHCFAGRTFLQYLHTSHSPLGLIPRLIVMRFDEDGERP